MPERPPDLEAVVRVLSLSGVDFVLIGGMALVLHGATSVTLDCDLAIASSTHNLKSIVRALSTIEPRPTHWNSTTEFVWDLRSLAGSHVKLRTLAGDLDLLLEVPGVDSYEGLKARSKKVKISGHLVHVASLEDLAQMKRAAGRTKDQIHLLEIEELKKLEAEGD